MFTRGTVTVVTATTGSSYLHQCVESVQDQTLTEVEHLLVIDGPEREAAVRAALADLDRSLRPPRLMLLPQATGKDNWLGHRIYGAASFLVNSEFIAYLDEDNWFDPDHLAGLVKAFRAQEAQWAFALRKIVDTEGKFVTVDNCECLGTLHHTFGSREDFLVDTSCFLIPRETAANLAPAWYRPAQHGKLKLDADRMLTRLLMRNFPKAATSRKHSVNYRVGNRPESVKAELFLLGNEIMRRTYPEGLPWEKPGT